MFNELFKQELRENVDQHAALSVLYFFREEGWQSGNFTTNLIRAIAAADSNNFQKMLRAFPNYASAVWLAQNDEDGIDFLRSFAQH